MIITNAGIGYNGRLGNQLFQFASLYGIARRCGLEVALPFSNMLERLETGADGLERPVKFNLPDIFEGVGEFVDLNIIRGHFRTLSEQSFTYDSYLMTECVAHGNINLHGYFQSPMYFDAYREDLLDILEFNHELINFKRGKPLVSIHVRRGDYLALQNNHPVCSHEYYDTAINYFDGCNFMFFSDDIGWCKENFVGPQFLFSEGFSESEDLQRMRLCDHNIIANSTFSWWGAYLNKNKSAVGSGMIIHKITLGRFCQSQQS
jgi:hypothetical protein